MRLIDIEAPCKIEIELDGGKCHATVTAPTVDAVPVPVRCKNCKFNYGLSAGHGFSSEDIVCSYWDSDGLDENDYCSHGEQFAKECD